MVEVVQDEIVVLELVQNDVENEGLNDAEWRRKVDLDDFIVLLCDVLFDGVVEDGVIQDVEDVGRCRRSGYRFEDGTVVVELWEHKVGGDKGEAYVIELLEDDVEVVDVLEDVLDVYEVGVPDVVDDLLDDFYERVGLDDLQVD